MSAPGHHDRRRLLLVRDRQPGPRTDAGRPARRAGHREGRRAAPGLPGPPRHERRRLFGHRRGRPRRAELVGADTRQDRRRPVQGRRKTTRRHAVVGSVTMSHRPPFPHLCRAGRRRRRAGPGCGTPEHSAAQDPPAAPPSSGFQSGDCNNVTDADVAKAVGSATFTKVVDSDAGCFWQENTMLGSFGRAWASRRGGIAAATWTPSGPSSSRPGGTLTELSVDGNKGFKASRRQRLQHLRVQGRRRHHLVDPDDESGHAARSVRRSPSSSPSSARNVSTDSAETRGVSFRI